jgi:hypothetical protein
MQFGFVTVVPKYLNFDTFFKGLLAIIIIIIIIIIITTTTTTTIIIILHTVNKCNISSYILFSVVKQFGVVSCTNENNR